MIKKLLLASLFIISTIRGNEDLVVALENCPKLPVKAPTSLSDIELYHSENGFHVLQNNKYRQIKPCFVDKQVRNVTKEQLAGFLKVGYLSLNQMSDNDFSLKAHVRGLGGGPVTAQAAYASTKTALWAAYWAACAHDPELTVHFFEFQAAIESVAMAAWTAGLAAPTP